MRRTLQGRGCPNCSFRGCPTCSFCKFHHKHGLPKSSQRAGWRRTKTIANPFSDAKLQRCPGNGLIEAISRTCALFNATVFSTYGAALAANLMRKPSLETTHGLQTGDGFAATLTPSSSLKHVSFCTQVGDILRSIAIGTLAQRELLKHCVDGRCGA